MCRVQAAPASDLDVTAGATRRNFEAEIMFIVLHGLQIQYIACLLLNVAMRAFTPRLDCACTAKPIINPLFGLVDNEFLGLHFTLKSVSRF